MINCSSYESERDQAWPAGLCERQRVRSAGGAQEEKRRREGGKEKRRAESLLGLTWIVTPSQHRAGWAQLVRLCWQTAATSINSSRVRGGGGGEGGVGWRYAAAAASKSYTPHHTTSTTSFNPLHWLSAHIWLGGNWIIAETEIEMN